MDLVKKKSRRKPTSKNDGQGKPKKWPTLAHIVLRNGSRVDIPKLPTTTSELTSYDHLRIALEYVALATHCLDRLGSTMTPRLADNFNMAPIRLNLEDSLNHLHYAIQEFHNEKGSS